MNVWSIFWGTEPSKHEKDENAYVQYLTPVGTVCMAPAARASWRLGIPGSERNVSGGRKH